MTTGGEADEEDIEKLRNTMKRGKMSQRRADEAERAELQRRLLGDMRGDPEVSGLRDKCEVSLLGGKLEDGTRLLKTTREGGRGMQPGVYFMHPYFFERRKAEGGKPTLMFCYQDKDGKGCKPSRCGILRIEFCRYKHLQAD